MKNYVTTNAEAKRLNKKILEMLNMQKALNDAIYKKHNTHPDWEQMHLALFDELGELNHELKSVWCWWKKTQELINRKKVLEELVDVWHFAMTIHQEETSFWHEEEYLNTFCRFNEEGSLISIYMDFFYYSNEMRAVLNLTYYLSFTIDDVYEAYIEKNKVNYERLKNGY